MSIVGEPGARRAHAFGIRFGNDGRAWAVWACFALLVVVSRLDSVYSLGNVFAVYREAGLRWADGRDLYPADLYFNYFPPAAVLFAAWSWLPFQLGGALWRIVNIAVFAFGFWRLGHGSEPRPSAAHFL